jgi:Sec-independent protein translocase protein TatA
MPALSLWHIAILVVLAVILFGGAGRIFRGRDDGPGGPSAA